MERKNNILNSENLNEKVSPRVELDDVCFERELFDEIRKKGKNLINSKNREGFLSEFVDLLLVVDKIKKSESVTDNEISEIEGIKIVKEIGFDERIFLKWATDDDNLDNGEAISLQTLITDGFFKRLKNKGVQFDFRKLGNIEFEEKLLEKVKESGDNLMLVRNRKQFLSEFGDLLFLIDEVRKFKGITNVEIEQMETVKNRQK